MDATLLTRGNRADADAGHSGDVAACIELSTRKRTYLTQNLAGRDISPALALDFSPALTNARAINARALPSVPRTLCEGRETG